VPISIISKWAGHYDSSFTMKTYVHASDDDLKQGRQALPLTSERKADLRIPNLPVPPRTTSLEIAHQVSSQRGSLHWTCAIVRR
jgi:hypothetical protein